MALTPMQDNQGQWFITGITANQNVPFSLGRRMFHPNNSPHYIGFDDNFTEPIIVRAFYDPSLDTVLQAPYEFAGYIQCMQLNFLATTPIPPQVYGGVLADRAPYVCDKAGYQFIDFMGPADARLRNITEPFYAYNGALLDGTLTNLTDFQRHPLPNGSLYYPASASVNQSLCASLFGEIATSLLTAQDILPLLTDDNLIDSIPVTVPQLANQEAYQIALQYLMSNGGELQGLQLSDVAGQVIGQYVLIALPNYEEMPPRLCISTRTTNGQMYVDIHLLEYDDIESLETDVTLQAFIRIYNFLEGANIKTPDAMQVENMPPLRGRGGLLANPYSALTPSDFCIELKYWTTALAHRVRGLRSISPLEALSTFTWSALFQYDDDTRRLALSTIREPVIVENYDWLTPYQQCQQAILNQRLANVTIDTSNFTKAAMRRDNLGAGSKLHFVSGTGMDLS